MGATGAVHVLDDAIHGSDALGTSLVLAEALEQVGFDLVLTGMASTDAEMSVVPSMLADRLGVNQATFAGELAGADGTVSIRREVEAASRAGQRRAPGGGVGHRPDRRGTLPGLQGDHDGQEEAGHHPDPRRSRRRPPPSGSRPPRTRVVGVEPAPARPPEPWSPTTARAAPSSPTSWPRGPAVIGAWPRPPRQPAARKEHHVRGSGAGRPGRDGVRKATLELLTVARRLGGPSAVVFGGATDAVVAPLGEYGATTVYAVAGAEAEQFLCVPAPRRSSPVPGDLPGRRPGDVGPDGKDVAARVAVRLDSGIVTDAVDLGRRGRPVVPPSRSSRGLAGDQRGGPRNPGHHRSPQRRHGRAGPDAARGQARDVAFCDAARGPRSPSRTPKSRRAAPT